MCLNTPWGFFGIAKNGDAQRCRVLHSCSDNSSATFLKILGPGHQRSGNQVRSSDPTSEKLYNRVTATVVERKVWNFQDLAYYQVPTTCISRIFYIGDLRSGPFRDLPIISQWGKTQMPQILIRSVQIVQNHAHLGYCWWSSVRNCSCDLRKGHLRSNNDLMRSNNDLMRSMYVFAYNFWLEWDRDLGYVLKRSPCPDASNNMQHDLVVRSPFDLDLRSKNKVDLLRSQHVQFDSSRRYKHNGTYIIDVHITITKLFVVKDFAQKQFFLVRRPLDAKTVDFRSNLTANICF